MKLYFIDAVLVCGWWLYDSWWDPEMLLTDGLVWAKDRVEFWEYKVVRDLNISSWGIWPAFHVWWLTAINPHPSFFPIYPTSGQTDKNAWVFLSLSLAGDSGKARLCLHAEVSLWLHPLTTVHTWGQPPFLALWSHFGPAADLSIT